MVASYTTSVIAKLIIIIMESSLYDKPLRKLIDTYLGYNFNSLSIVIIQPPNTTTLRTDVL